MTDTLIPQSNQSEAVPSQETTSAEQPAVNQEALAPAEWFWADGVKGEGQKPDYLLDKFDSVASMAAAYIPAQKQLGAFTGAPEKYTIETSEGNAFSIDESSDAYKEFEGIARDMKMSDTAFNKITQWYVKQNIAAAEAEKGTQLTEEQQNEAKRAHHQDEMKKLGPNGDELLANVGQWAQNIFSAEQFEVFKTLCTNAETVQMFNALRHKGQYSHSPSMVDVAPNTLSQLDTTGLRREMNRPEYRTDPKFKARIDNEYKRRCPD